MENKQEISVKNNNNASEIVTVGDNSQAGPKDEKVKKISGGP